jgi:hypothetical protein
MSQHYNRILVLKVALSRELDVKPTAVPYVFNFLYLYFVKEGSIKNL